MKFQVTSGEIALSDPCYDPDTWCMGYVKAQNGTWIGSTTKWTNEQTCGWGDRTATLEARLEGTEIAENDPRWVDLPYTLGVDSGQMGIFDAAYYRANGGKGEYHDETTFYGKVCAATYNSYTNVSKLDGAVIDDRGVIAPSGVGDGAYSAEGIHNEEGELIAVRVIFLEEDDEDFDEEDDLDEAA